jgi:hypothetical protein
LHTEPEAQAVVEVQGTRQEPSTQSEPAVHCEALVHEGSARGRHSPTEHCCVAPQSESVEQPRTHALLMQ